MAVSRGSMETDRPSFRLIGMLLVASVLALACGSQPIPLVAVEGTTISIAVPGSLPTGYGKVYSGLLDPSTVPAYNPSSPWEDEQNGELRFLLHDDGGGFVTSLPLRYITRVNPSPSSAAAVDHDLNATFHSRGQTLAFIDIPVFLGPGEEGGDYKISVRRVRRKPGSEDPSNAFEWPPLPVAGDGFEWTGWGNDGIAGEATDSQWIPIHIKKHDGEERFTSLLGWENEPGTGIVHTSAALSPLVPYPDFEIRVPEVGSSATPPAAWEVQYTYPRTKLRIRGVSLRRAALSEAVVRWDAEDPEEVVPCGSIIPGLLRIRVIDPDQLTEGVRIAYELRNFDQSCGARATDSDFDEIAGSFKAYDVDGNVLTGYSADIDETSFF